MAEYDIRAMQPEEYGLLKEFLYEAIYLPEGVPRPPYSVVEDPILCRYWKDFGTGSCDMAWCAVKSGPERSVVGAIWMRRIVAFGYVDGAIPELAMAVKKEYRNQGLGKRLLSALIDGLKAANLHRVSLAVQKENFAYGLYRNAGFQVVRETPDEYIMLYADNE